MAMAELFIRKEGTDRAWRVWPNPESLEPGAVQEASSYLFELKGSDTASAADLFIDGVKLEALRTGSPEQAVWRWLPGFHAGSIQAELRIPGITPRRFEFDTDPDLRKLTRDHFDTMIREILEDTFALFSLSSFRKGIARGSGGEKPPAIARLEFLRSRLQEIEASIAAISLKPRRQLTADDVSVPYHRAVRATAPEILRSFRSGNIRKEEDGPTRLPLLLKGHLPAKVLIRKSRSSGDTPEHRQMLGALRAWSAWLGSAADSLQRAVPQAEVSEKNTLSIWSVRCRVLAHRVEGLTAAPMFAEVTQPSPRLTLTAVFRNDPLYRRFYQIARDMNLGLAAVFGDFLNMPIARTYDLYELWCFLRLVRAAVERWGDDHIDFGTLFATHASGGVTLASGSVSVTIGEKWELLFQKQYREFWMADDRRGSFSRTMTPDIALTRKHSGRGRKHRLIILDSKYRVEQGLNDALSSIHMYRDALVQELPSGKPKGIVAAAYLLTPYVPEFGASYQATGMPSRLFHPEYRSSFRFGAAMLRPGMTTQEIATTLETIISDAKLA